MNEMSVVEADGRDQRGGVGGLGRGDGWEIGKKKYR